MIVDLVNIVTL